MNAQVQGLLHGVWPNDTNALLALNARLRQLTTATSASTSIVRVAVLGGYTTTLLTPLVQLFLARLGLTAEVWQGDYGLVDQIALECPPALVDFNPHIVFLCVGTEHLDLESIDREATRWQALWQQLHDRTGCDVLLNTFEPPHPRLNGSFDVRDRRSATSAVRRLNETLIERAPAYVHLHDVEGLAATWGRAQWRDNTLYDMTKLPCAFDMLPVYARSVAAVIGALRGRSKRCLILDLDNTIWGGVLGDDGIANVRVGQGDGESEAFARFQRYLKQLKQRGVLLALCSKNDEALVRQCFAARPEMPLAWDDFAAVAINWQPKHQNVVQIANRLSLGLDTFVFVDDNPAEREIVRQFLPLVEVVDLPADPSVFAEAVSAGLWFEAVSVTDEDRDRTAQYRANVEREAAEQGVGDYTAFLASLQMTATIRAVDAATVTRVTQLINKTNQFNLTTRRYAQAQVERAAGDAEGVTLGVTLRDRFGDHGLISAVIGTPTVTSDRRRAWEIDTWVMSCRVLKRGVEQRVCGELLRQALERGIHELHGTYVPTERNGMVAALFSDLGFSQVAADPDGTTRWRLVVNDEALARNEQQAPPIEVVP